MIFRPFTINCRGTVITYRKPVVMAVLNATADSFYSGSRTLDPKEFVTQACRLVENGADILDIGAASSRPGAALVPSGEECQRLLPLIAMLRKEMPHIPISVDTYNSSTAEAVIEAGADIINDISGGMFDSLMFSTVARLHVPYVLMHTTDVPSSMQRNTMPDEPDPLNQLALYFSQKLDELHSLGVADVILDPGFGFGKTVKQNYYLLNRLSTLCSLFPQPVLVGVSRKSMITSVLECSPEEALNGTTVINTMALLGGAAILRVHDPREAAQAIKLVTFSQSIQSIESIS